MYNVVYFNRSGREFVLPDGLAMNTYPGATIPVPDNLIVLLGTCGQTLAELCREPYVLQTAGRIADEIAQGGADIVLLKDALFDALILISDHGNPENTDVDMVNSIKSRIAKRAPNGGLVVMPR